MIHNRFALTDALEAPEPSLPEEPRLASRLQACARLLDAAAEELTALENGDVAKRHEVGALREELTREIHLPARDEDEDGGRPELRNEELLMLLPQEVARVLAEALFALEERDQEERRMQDRWTSIEGDALKAMHVGGRIVPLRAGRYPDRPPTDGRLDLRF